MEQMDSRRMCPHCRAFITNKDRTCPYCNESVGARAIDRRNPAAILGMIPHARFNTVVILLINFGLFLATALYSMGAGNGDALWNMTWERWWRSAPSTTRGWRPASGGAWSPPASCTAGCFISS